VVSIVALPVFYALGAVVYQVYYQSFEKRGQESLRGLAFFFGLLFVTEVSLILVFGVDYCVTHTFLGRATHGPDA
jgi:branched-chain amino acid transport system permease protein